MRRPKAAGGALSPGVPLLCLFAQAAAAHEGDDVVIEFSRHVLGKIGEDFHASPHALVADEHRGAREELGLVLAVAAERAIEGFGPGPPGAQLSLLGLRLASVDI